MSDVIVYGLFGCAALFAALSGWLGKARPLLALLAALGVVFGVLAALTLGWTLAQLRSPVLAVCAAAMAALLFGKGESRA